MAAAKSRQRSTAPADPMNKWESQYAMNLHCELLGGMISHWGFETVKIRLAKRTWYTPDFFIIRDGKVEFHEVKGHWRDDARVKTKVAAEQCRWATFYIVTKDKNGHWTKERVIP